MKARLARGWWRDVGFRDEPRSAIAWGRLTLYRAWGGSSQESGSERSAGVCFSTQRPQTRTEAESLFSVWEWGNSCRWLTEFELRAGEEYFAGWVDPGSVLDPSLQDPRLGVQIFVANPIRSKVITGRRIPLIDDTGGVFVVPGPPRSQ